MNQRTRAYPGANTRTRGSGVTITPPSSAGLAVSTSRPAVIRVRHHEAPNPNGCRWCGEDQGNHGRRWVASHGLHQWEEPIRAQRLARMQARRARRAL